MELEALQTRDTIDDFNDHIAIDRFVVAAFLPGFWVVLAVLCLSLALAFKLLSKVLGKYRYRKYFERPHDNYVKIVSPLVLGKETKFSEPPPARWKWHVRWFYMPYAVYNECFMVLISVLSCSLFIYETIDIAADENDDVLEQEWLIAIEFFISVVFLYDWLLHLSISQTKIRYVILQPGPYIDLASSMAGLMGPVMGRYYYGFQFLRFFRIFRGVHFLSRYQHHPILYTTMAKIMTICIALGSVLLAAAGFFWVAENEVQNTPLDDDDVTGLIVDYLDSLYFVLVTITTVGYGDRSPKSRIGKAVIILFILAAVSFLPWIINQFSTIYKLYNEDRSYNGPTNHVVIFGETAALQNFTLEFYKSDPRTRLSPVNIVVMAPELSEANKKFSEMPILAGRVRYLYGSATNSKDLWRSKIHKSSAVLLLPSTAEESKQSDAESLLASISIRNYINERKKRNKFVREEFKVMVEVQNLPYKKLLNAANVPYVVCGEELQLGMVAQNCESPGLLALMGNILRTNHSGKNSDLLMQKYLRGTEYSMYQLSFGRTNTFSGQLFSSVARFFFDDPRFSNSLLMGVKGGKKGTDIFINPGPHYRMRDYDTPFVLMTHKDLPNITDALFKYFYSVDDFSPYDDIYGEEIDLSNSESDDPEDPQLERKKIRAATMSKNDKLESIVSISSKKSLQVKSEHKSFQELTLADVSDAQFSTKHIAVIGCPQGLVHFVTPLRSGHLKLRPIVILDTTKPTQWKKIKHFEEVYFVKGSPLEVKDLLRAGVLTAKNIVVMPKVYTETDEYTFQDATAINIYRLIVDILQESLGTDQDKWPFMICSLEHGSNVQLIDTTDAMKRWVQQKSGVDLENSHKWTQIEADVFIKKHPLYMSGHIYFSGLLNTLLGQAYYGPDLIVATEKLIGSIFTLPVEIVIEGHPMAKSTDLTYAQVFHHVIKTWHWLTIGIYRLEETYVEKKKKRRMKPKMKMSRKNKNKEVKQNDPADLVSFRYVLTHPPGDTKMKRDDVVFVIISDSSAVTTEEESEWSSSSEMSSSFDDEDSIHSSDEDDVGDLTESDSSELDEEKRAKRRIEKERLRKRRERLRRRREKEKAKKVQKLRIQKFRHNAWDENEKRKQREKRKKKKKKLVS
eukprot:CAMPEP_0174253074 /NCGR_PEP_ID=MMETSP0439-20130205/2464_1 /TAXON_ID=0 /ORGANISM="Stereomyxa ramosa, Strain Chinc5" /LENGTH=1132 /DNA_ID=CAMNT_0015333899 /DNA_START=23 /DNA_END=3421 /DNA_ORIENTATION=+